MSPSLSMMALKIEMHRLVVFGSAVVDIKLKKLAISAVFLATNSVPAARLVKLCASRLSSRLSIAVAGSGHARLPDTFASSTSASRSLDRSSSRCACILN